MMLAIYFFALVHKTGQGSEMIAIADKREVFQNVLFGHAFKGLTKRLIKSTKSVTSLLVDVSSQELNGGGNDALTTFAYILTIYSESITRICSEFS